MNTLIIVPAYNEESKIVEVLNDLKNNGYKSIVVVDDGSVDNTGVLARKAGVIVIRHVLNCGLGAALKTGFTYALKVKPDILVTFDGDGQHKARDIKKLIAPIERDESDVVIGSRLLVNIGMSMDRKIINILSNILVYFVYGVWTTDSQSGFRAFNKKAYQNIIIKTQRMEVSSEFFREIKRLNLRVKEIPVEPIYTDYSLLKGQKNSNAFSVALKILLRVFR